MQIRQLAIILTGLACTARSATLTPSPLIARADSLAASGDTAGALAQLDSIVRKDPRDAAAWHRRGMLAWAKARRSRRLVTPMRLENVALLNMADTSLRLAHRLDRQNARYALELGRYFLYAELITLRIQAPGKFRHAIEVARRAGDGALVAEALDEIGMVHWRGYETKADRRMLTGLDFVQVEALVTSERSVRGLLEQRSVPMKPPIGLRDYDRALASFDAALSADPTNSRATRHLYMALAATADWTALRKRARRRLTAGSNDARSWLALGLANHRLGDERDATLAFDSALALLPPRDLARYTQLSRILRPVDSVRYQRMSQGARADFERVFWVTADPLAITPGNEYRLEFLSRVTEAELRWTSDDFDLRGADTDRGQIWVCYGPPGVVASFAPRVESIEGCTVDDVALPSQTRSSKERMYDPEPLKMRLLCSEAQEAGVPLLVWHYPELTLHFVFRAPPTFGIAGFAGRYTEFADQARSAAPAAWSNLPLWRLALDSIPMVVTRFRAPGDSTDALVVAEFPLRRLVPRTDSAPRAVDIFFGMFDSRGLPIARDSTRDIVSRQATSAAEIRVWRKRFGRGSVLYRVEALEPDSMRAARALGELSALPPLGYGVSDLLLAERVTLASGAAESWRDFIITPSAGVFRRGSPIGLLWETYWLTTADGQNRYRVSLMLEPEPLRGIRGLAAKVIGGAREVVGLSGHGSERVELSYVRKVSARLAQIDYLTLDLGTVPAGSYRIRLTVTDLVAQRTKSVDRQIRIRDDPS